LHLAIPENWMANIFVACIILLGRYKILNPTSTQRKIKKKNTASKSNLQKLKSSNGVGNYIVTDPTFLCCKKMKSGLFISGFKPVVRKRKI